MLSETIEIIGWTLLHFVWQGIAVGLLAAVVLAAMRRCSANARYLTAVAALSVMAVLPIVTFMLLRGTPASPAGPARIAGWLRQAGALSEEMIFLLPGKWLREVSGRVIGTARGDQEVSHGWVVGGCRIVGFAF